MVVVYEASIVTNISHVSSVLWYTYTAKYQGCYANAQMQRAILMSRSLTCVMCQIASL